MSKANQKSPKHWNLSLAEHEESYEINLKLLFNIQEIGKRLKNTRLSPKQGKINAKLSY